MYFFQGIKKPSQTNPKPKFPGFFLQSIDDVSAKGSANRDCRDVAESQKQVRIQ